MNNKIADPRQNRLLNMLPPSEYARLVPALERVSLRVGDILAEPNKMSRFVYFPVDSMVSLYYPMDHGTSSEIALIGNEGMFSIVPILGGETMPYMAVVETSGQAFRLDGRILKGELDRSRHLRHILLLYTQALFTQMAQLSICGRHHSLREQLCLHLLLIHDRALSDRFALTQQTTAHMLGVRRESVTKVSGELRGDGLIAYRRGYVTVLDRRRLECECCECCSVVREEFFRLLG